MQLTTSKRLFEIEKFKKSEKKCCVFIQWNNSLTLRKNRKFFVDLTLHLHFQEIIIINNEKIIIMMIMIIKNCRFHSTFTIPSSIMDVFWCVSHYVCVRLWSNDPYLSLSIPVYIPQLSLSLLLSVCIVEWHLGLVCYYSFLIFFPNPSALFS